MAINPLQLPGGFSTPQVDFSTLGNLPAEYKKAQVESARKAALSDLPRLPDGSPDFGSAAAKLAQVGDIQGAQTLATLANAQSQNAWTRTYQGGMLDINRGQLDLARDQAREKPTLQKVKDAAGNERLVQVDPRGNSRTIDTGEPGASPNPFAENNGKMTEGQSTAALYARRMLASEPTLRKFESVGTDRVQRGLSMLPGAGKLYNPNSPEFQQFDQARRDFINAVLRRESGAVISDAEFENANKQYFPAPGDAPKTVEQKRRNRIEAIKGIAGAAGPNWKPPAGVQGDSVVPNPNAQPRAPGPAQPQQAAPQGGPVRIESKEQRDALPPGTSYIAPDGQVRVKQ